MLTIEIPADPKEAVRIARKAALAARKEADERAAARREAYSAAERNGFAILRRLFGQSGGCADGYAVRPDDPQTYPCDPIVSASLRESGCRIDVILTTPANHVGAIVLLDDGDTEVWSIAAGAVVPLVAVPPESVRDAFPLRD